MKGKNKLKKESKSTRWLDDSHMDWSDSFLYGVLLKIIKQTKKIQLLKLEGYTNWQIYKNQILKYLILILCLQTIMNIILYIWQIATSIQNAIPYNFDDDKSYVLIVSRIKKKRYWLFWIITDGFWILKFWYMKITKFQQSSII